MAKPHIITGLDIGTGTIKILTASKKPGEENLEVLSFAEETSSGIRRGIVIDVDKASEIISCLLKKIQGDSGREINNVYLSIGGAHIFCTLSRGLVSVSRADQKISEEDVNRTLQAAQTFSLPSNKEILEVFPKEFIVDGEKGIKEPLGMQGVRLETEVLALGAFSPYLKNLTQTVLDSGLQINDLTPTPIASARAILTPREKELGVILLDIGAGTTGFCVFEEGVLIYTKIFPIGSANITNDIAICLKTDIDTAEKIKLEFGACQIFSRKLRKSKKTKKVSRKESEKIRIEGEEPLVFSKKILAEIIEDRVSEIFREVQKELKKIGKAGLLPSGVVLTGGGAKLPKIRELSKKEFRLPCRIGIPRGFFPFRKTLL